MKKFILLSLISVILLMSVGYSDTFSLDGGCGDNYIYEQGQGGNAEYVYGNDCIELVMRKNTYNPNIDIQDKLNEQNFKMHLFGVDERDLSTTDETSYPFASMSLQADISNGFLEYTNGDVTIGYKIIGNQIKSVATLTNLQQTYVDSEYYLKVLIHKNENDLVQWIDVEADGNVISSAIEIKTAGQNTFYYQLLGDSDYNTFIIDPIFIVDYNASPGSRLYKGDVDSDDESDFQNIFDITSGVSDNNSATQYEFYRRTLSDPTFIWYKEESVDDTSKVSSVGGTVSNLLVDYADDKYGRLLLPGGAQFRNGDLITIYMKPKDNDAKNRQMFLKNSGNSVQYGVFNTGTDTGSFSYRYLILSNIATTTNEIFFHDNSLVTGGYTTNIDYIDVETYNETGIAFSGRWAETYDGNYTWFLGMKKETAGTHNMTVYAHSSSNKIVTTQFKEKVISGTGWFYIPVDDLMIYMQSVVGLPFTQLRTYPILSANFSEFVLRAEANHTGSPNITECFLSDTFLGCNSTFHLNCTVFDDAPINEFLFTINDVNNSGYQIDTTHWGLDIFNSEYDTINYNWTNVFATDLFGNTTQNETNFSFTYECIEACQEIWVEDTINCLTNDTYFSTYTDTNACNTTVFLPATNGTYQPCNYCSEDLEPIYGECQETNNQTLDWVDNNYTTCCQITGLSNDCSILSYPFNSTTENFCFFYSAEMGVINCPEQFNFAVEEKEYCLSEIPLNYSTEQFKCISYVHERDTGQLIQTNPEYKERSETILDFVRGNPETREFFTPANRLVNFYLTNKNLNPEKYYVLTIQCNSDLRSLSSEHEFQVGYQNLDNVFPRLVWIKDNLVYIVPASIIIIFILGYIAIMLKMGLK